MLRKTFRYETPCKFSESYLFSLWGVFFQILSIIHLNMLHPIHFRNFRHFGVWVFYLKSADWLKINFGNFYCLLMQSRIFSASFGTKIAQIAQFLLCLNCVQLVHAFLKRGLYENHVKKNIIMSRLHTFFTTVSIPQLHWYSPQIERIFENNKSRADQIE